MAQFRRTPHERRGADVFVRVYGSNGDLLAQTKTIRNAPANLLLDVPLITRTFVVRGQVRFADGSPLAGARVRAYDKDLRLEEPLGEPATTDRDGRYEIIYTAGEFARAEKASADLRVSVHEKGEEPVSSDILFNAPPDAVIDLVLPRSAHGPSEFEVLVQTLLPRLKGQAGRGTDLPIEALKEKDVDSLARATGIERQRIDWLPRASTLAQASASPAEPTPSTKTRARIRASQHDGIPTEPFYGWFRRGLPTELRALSATSTDTLLATLKASMEERIVPPMSSSILGGIKAEIEKLKLDLVLQAPAAGIPASLGGLLATLPSPLTPDQRRALAGAVSDLRPDDPQLAKRIKAIHGFSRVGVARALQLRALTSGHLPLVTALQSRFEDAKQSAGTLKPLATLRPDEWLDLAYTHGTPPGSTVTPVAYADALSAAVEQQHPHAALVAHFTDGRRLASHPGLTEVGTFLRANQDFDIATANIDAVESQSNLDGVKQPS